MVTDNFQDDRHYFTLRNNPPDFVILLQLIYLYSGKVELPPANKRATKHHETNTNNKIWPDKYFSDLIDVIIYITLRKIIKFIVERLSIYMANLFVHWNFSS